MRQLGTILPDATTLRRADAHADRLKASRQRAAESMPELNGTTRRVVGGEVRYYDTTDQYAIVSRQGAVIWFQVRPDGDYRI